MKAIAAAARYMRVALPGRVESYDAATQTCSVQPYVQDGIKDETGTRQAVRLPVVTSVPVVFPGAGAYSITWPLAVGDTVLLLFASSSIDRWLALGGEVDPIDDRRHHVTDAIAIAGLRALPDALGAAAVDSGAMVISGGGAAAASPIATQATAAEFMTVLAGVTDSAGACAALHTALASANWPAQYVASVKAR